MVLMEVEFVTGWEAANPDSLTNLKEVQRVETDKEENKVNSKGFLSMVFYYLSPFSLCYISMR